MDHKYKVRKTGRLQHIIQWQMSVHMAIAGLVTVIIFTSTIYFNGQKVAAEVQDLKAEIKDLRLEIMNGQSRVMQTSNTLALVQFRVDSVESDIRALKKR